VRGRSLVVGTLLLALTGCGASRSAAHKLLWAGPPARFRPAAGWHVRTTGAAPVADGMSTITVAGTVPWRDSLVGPPDRTVPTLRASHGIEIFVGLESGRGLLDGRRSTGIHLGPIAPATHGSGPVIPGLSTQGGTFAVAGQYVGSVTVIYGGRYPTNEQRAETQAELARLVLPARWPHWWRG
jgi:hypothetical protein